jgi:hypothetical protein
MPAQTSRVQTKQQTTEIDQEVFYFNHSSLKDYLCNQIQYNLEHQDDDASTAAFLQQR